MTCTMGVAPSTLTVLPANKVLATTPGGNIMDNKPLLNVLPFGMCQSPANPQVAAATAAAMGVLTPMPCMPNIPGPWAPGSPTVLLGNQPALTKDCMLACAYGGVITFGAPGQTKVSEP